MMTQAMLTPDALAQRQVLLYPGEDGYFVVKVPSLPGCVTQGKTGEEALANIDDNRVNLSDELT